MGPRAKEAMERTDRRHFLPHDAPRDLVDRAYVDMPLPIGHGQTCSAPHMHAACLTLLESRLLPGAHALDVGAGAGFLTSAMARMVCSDPAGRVLGVEVVPSLARLAAENVESDVWEAWEAGAVRVVSGDGLDSDEVRSWGPYDAIHVGAASHEGIPRELTDVLAPGGLLVIPVASARSAETMPGTEVTRSRHGRHRHKHTVRGSDQAHGALSLFDGGDEKSRTC